jgi:hypothetical protein
MTRRTEDRQLEWQSPFDPQPASSLRYPPTALRQDTAPVAAEISEAYEAVAGLMYGPVVPREECLATVHAFADLL